MARCTCRYQDGEGPGAEPLERDLFCPFHGRIRDMDSGASPFVDPNAAAFAASEMYESDYQRRLQREANEADAHSARPAPKTRAEFIEALMKEAPATRFVSPEEHESLRRAVEDEARDVKFADRFGISPRCRCTYTSIGEQEPIRTFRQGCPVHDD